MAIVSYANGKIRAVKDIDYVLRNAKYVFKFVITKSMLNANLYTLCVVFTDERMFSLPWQSMEAFKLLIDRPKFHNKQLSIGDFKGTVQAWLYLNAQMEQKKK